MNLAILNANLAPGGKTAYLAGLGAEFAAEHEHASTVYHLHELDLPGCDGRTCYGHPSTIKLTADLEPAEAILLISPVYNYDLNGAAKNLIELTGNSWKGKAVGLVCQAGGQRSYLAPLGFINSLAVDYRCLVSPRYVYSAREEFLADNTLPPDGDVRERLNKLIQELAILSDAAKRIANL